jgi:hypothetical protein
MCLVYIKRGASFGTSGPVSHAPKTSPPSTVMTMSTRRQDEENQSSEAMSDDSDSPHNGRSATSGVTGGVTNGRTTSNPITLPIIILCKFFAFVSNNETKVVQSLKDILLGVILGVIFVTSLTILDYRGIINVESARKIRMTLSTAFSDKRAIAEFERQMGVKVMPIEKYNMVQKEIESLIQKLPLLEPRLTNMTKKLEETLKEMEPIKKEFDLLSKHPKVGLDKFCGDCNWPRSGPKQSCNARVDIISKKLKKRILEAKLLIMKDGRCKMYEESFSVEKLSR